MQAKRERMRKGYVCGAAVIAGVILLIGWTQYSTSPAAAGASASLHLKVSQMELTMLQLKDQLKRREAQAEKYVRETEAQAEKYVRETEARAEEYVREITHTTPLKPGAPHPAFVKKPSPKASLATAKAAGTPTTLDHMKYWLHGTSQSPIKGHNDRKPNDRSWLPPTRENKFLILDSDSGGFNNIRLAFETGIVIAVLTGRTVVLPAKKTWYLLGDARIGFEDFFDIDDLRKLVPCIYMDEYKKLEGGSRVSRPVEGNVLTDVFAFPSVAAVKQSHSNKRGELKFHRADSAGGAPEGREGGRRKMLEMGAGSMIYDTDVLTVDNRRNRLLATWHTFFVFGDEAHELSLKRFMRDCVHYTNEIFDFAARGIDEMGGWGTYSAMHTRRGDFQYQEVKLGADKLFSNVAPLLKRSGKERLYIMTDEQNTPFFQHFLDSGYKVSFFKDLQTVGKVPYHLIGMVEQMISGGSNLFIGTRLSTFSSYTIRTRGYQVGAKNKEVFYADRKYSGSERDDGNEKLMDTSNTMFGGGEMGYFREPQNVWVEEDWRR